MRYVIMNIESSTWIDINNIYYAAFNIFIYNPRHTLYMKDLLFKNYTCRDELLWLTTTNDLFITNNTFQDIDH